MLPANVETIGKGAFVGTHITGTLVIPANVKMIGYLAFFNSTKLKGLDLSKAASLASIGAQAFQGTAIRGPIVTPFKVPTYTTGGSEASFPPGVTIVKG